MHNRPKEIMKEIVMPDRLEIHTMMILLTEVIMTDMLNLFRQGKEQLHKEMPIQVVHLLENL